MKNFADLIKSITPETYETLKIAIEIGKWGDGTKLTQEQKELTMQAMIMWEMTNLQKKSAPVIWAVRNVKSKHKNVYLKSRRHYLPQQQGLCTDDGIRSWRHQ